MLIKYIRKKINRWLQQHRHLCYLFCCGMLEEAQSYDIDYIKYFLLKKNKECIIN